MIQVNIGDHAPDEKYGYVPFPNNSRREIMWARTKAIWIAKFKPGANVYFKSLPYGRSLSELLGDNSIWINYHPTLTAYGQTNFVGGREIAISASCCRLGRWTVLATLVHELAHVDGAPGGTSKAAELAVLACGMGRASERNTGVNDPYTPYDPTIQG